MPEKKKPDLVVYNEETGTYDAALRPYATSVSAPKITTDDLTTWKNNYVKAFNHRTQARFDAIKQEYQSLLEGGLRSIRRQLPIKLSIDVSYGNATGT